MNEQSVFSKRHIEEVTQAKRTLLDELGLPPAMTQYIRKNSRSIQVIFICLFVGICLWSYFDYFTTKQKNDSAALLAQAMAEPTDTARSQILEKVLVEYSGTGAALWSEVVLAHQMLETDRDQAIDKLKTLADKVDRDNPLYPLLQFDLAQLSEMNQNIDQALSYYQNLTTIQGFAGISYLAMARIHEGEKDMPKAREMYEKAKDQAELPSTSRKMIEDKLTRF